MVYWLDIVVHKPIVDSETSISGHVIAEFTHGIDKAEHVVARPPRKTLASIEFAIVLAEKLLLSFYTAPDFDNAEDNIW